ncbi:Cortactin-Binding Protein 2 [Manis pentadactyla]|nr:Cortactin-Binding Protein 2 [Manis pentadactyla]
MNLAGCPGICYQELSSSCLPSFLPLQLLWSVSLLPQYHTGSPFLSPEGQLESSEDASALGWAPGVPQQPPEWTVLSAEVFMYT